MNSKTSRKRWQNQRPKSTQVGTRREIAKRSFKPMVHRLWKITKENSGLCKCDLQRLEWQSSFYDFREKVIMFNKISGIELRMLSLQLNSMVALNISSSPGCCVFSQSIVSVIKLKQAEFKLKRKITKFKMRILLTVFLPETIRFSSENWMWTKKVEI